MHYVDNGIEIIELSVLPFLYNIAISHHTCISNMYLLLVTHSFVCYIQYCIVLFCIVLYCIVLYCIVLYCIVLYYEALY